jgi:beta-barrel assembly-enhancing protease
MNAKILLLIASAALCAGCFSSQFNPATNRQETLMYDDDREKSLGASVALSVEKQLEFNMEVDVNERVERILKRIEAVADRKDVVYVIHVIEDDEVNAFSLPGGYIYIYKGLIDRVKNDDQLAGVIAHEVAHVTAKHAIKRLQGAYGATVLTGVAIVSGNGQVAAGIDLAASSVFFANSREDEFESDELGIRYMKQAGYDPVHMATMLNILLEYQAKQPPRRFSYWRSHPYIPQRIARAEAKVKGRTEYREYLNLTGEDRFR